MNVDITELLIFFDELMAPTDEERKVYWFKTTREDQVTIVFVLSILEKSIGFIIKNNTDLCFSHIHLQNCSEVKILDQKKKCLEVLHSNGRCFLSLLGNLS